MMRLLRKKWVFAVLLICFVLLLVFKSDMILTKIYPIYYKQEIRQSAEKYNMNPFLIAAMIRVESNYQSDIQSKKGAIGLMQLMPDTADWVLESGNFTAKSDEIRKPGMNIEMGTWYIAWLHK